MPGPAADTRWLVLQLAMEPEFQRHADEGPAPNKRKIAAELGVDRRRVQAILAGLAVGHLRVSQAAKKLGLPLR